MNFVTYGFPLSIFLWIGGALLGAFLSFVFFGTMTFAILFTLYILGMLHIKPLFEKIQSFLQYMFPNTFANIKENMKISFPITINPYYTEEKERLPKDTPYIFIWHPHGLFSCANFYHCASGQTDFFQKTRSVVHTYMKYIPFSEELFSPYNTVFSDYDSMKDQIIKKESIGVVLGGASEILYTEPHTMKLHIKEKRGIFRLALTTGTPLAPVLVYGENELFALSKNPLIEIFQAIAKAIHVVLPIPTLESMYQWTHISQEPLKKPVQTIVGPPIHVTKKVSPTFEDIEELRSQYFTALEKLYTETKPAYYKPLEIV